MIRISFLMAALLAVALPASAEECGFNKCGSEKAAAADGVAAQVAKLEKSAAAGCKSSAAKLEKLAGLVRVTDRQFLAASIEGYLECDGQGCESTDKTVARIRTLLAAPKQRVALSAYAARLEGGCEKGCEKSKAAVKTLSTELGAEWRAAIIKLETSAAKGCAKSGARLALLDRKVGRQPELLSLRIDRIAAAAHKGCDQSKAVLASLTEGRESKCCQALAADVRKLETSAGKGCAKSADKLLMFDARLAGKPFAECTDCEECPEECCPDAGTKQ